MILRAQPSRVFWCISHGQKTDEVAYAPEPPCRSFHASGLRRSLHVLDQGLNTVTDVRCEEQAFNTFNTLLTVHRVQLHCLARF